MQKKSFLLLKKFKNTVSAQLCFRVGNYEVWKAERVLTTIKIAWRQY